MRAAALRLKILRCLASFAISVAISTLRSLKAACIPFAASNALSPCDTTLEPSSTTVSAAALTACDGGMLSACSTTSSTGVLTLMFLVSLPLSLCRPDSSLLMSLRVFSASSIPVLDFFAFSRAVTAAFFASFSSPIRVSTVASFCASPAAISAFVKSPTLSAVLAVSAILSAVLTTSTVLSIVSPTSTAVFAAL